MLFLDYPAALLPLRVSADVSALRRALGAITVTQLDTRTGFLVVVDLPPPKE